MEDYSQRNPDFEKQDIFAAVNHYILLFFGLSCLLSSIFLQAIFFTLGYYRIGISIAALLGIVAPIYLLARRFPGGFGSQLRILRPDSALMVRVCIASLMMVVVIDHIYLLSQRLFPVPENFIQSLEALKPHGTVSFIVTFLGLCVIVPFAEETLFRGLIQRIFEFNMNPVAAFILAGILFGIVHISAHLLITIALFGIFLGFIFFITGNMIYTAAAHAIFNTVSFLQLAFIPQELLDEPPFYTRHFWILVAAAVILGLLLAGMKKGARRVGAPKE